MRSLAERWEEMQEDPAKMRRVFTVIWAAAYGMLMLGAFLVVLVFDTDIL